MKKSILICLSAVALAGCGAKQESAIAASNAAPAANSSVATTTARIPVAEPRNGPAVAEAPAGLLTGQVVETMDAGGYTYLRLKTASGEVWAAVKQEKIKVGSTATVAAQMTMDKFESKTLNRTFDKIVFGTLAAPGMAAAPGSMMPASGSQAPAANPAQAAEHMKTGAANVGDVKVAKAVGSNAKTIAETWASKAAVKDKTVVVRGKVVKFLGGIMGRNWMHLRDGSGSAARGDNDITVTTMDRAAVGDVVVVTGVVRLDKDFGAGYVYPVIIEEAKVSK